MGGCGRLWEAAGGCGRLWGGRGRLREAVGGCGRLRALTASESAFRIWSARAASTVGAQGTRAADPYTASTAAASLASRQQRKKAVERPGQTNATMRRRRAPFGMGCLQRRQRALLDVAFSIRYWLVRLLKVIPTSMSTSTIYITHCGQRYRALYLSQCVK